jgi:hypothetical protein
MAADPRKPWASAAFSVIQKRLLEGESWAVGADISALANVPTREAAAELFGALRKVDTVEVAKDALTQVGAPALPAIQAMLLCFHSRGDGRQLEFPANDNYSDSTAQECTDWTNKAEEQCLTWGFAPNPRIYRALAIPGCRSLAPPGSSETSTALWCKDAGVIVAEGHF